MIPCADTAAGHTLCVCLSATSSLPPSPPHSLHLLCSLALHLLSALYPLHFRFILFLSFSPFPSCSSFRLSFHPVCSCVCFIFSSFCPALFCVPVIFPWARDTCVGSRRIPAGVRLSLAPSPCPPLGQVCFPTAFLLDSGESFHLPGKMVSEPLNPPPFFVYVVSLEEEKAEDSPLPKSPCWGGASSQPLPLPPPPMGARMASSVQRRSNAGLVLVG